MARAIDPLPTGVALLALGLGVAAITFGSIGEDDVSFARTQWTALLAMALAAPAILLYARGRSQTSEWWRSFWTAGLLAYLLHFWWAVFRTYNGDFAAVIERQGLVAYSNFLVTILWALDVVAAWLPPRERVASPVHFVTWLLVALSFLASATLFHGGLTALLGYALGAALLAVLVARLFLRRSEPTLRA